jgi:predicted transcriptional regulator
MIEFSARKIKINLSDYDYEKDIENRVLMAEFSDFDREVLEEILFSSLKISVKNFSKNMEKDEKSILPHLEKLSKTDLFELKDQTITVNKKLRKYFEFEILKLDNNFKPTIEFLQGLLKKIPIQILPIWYSIPRTSNSIFESIVEKYLITPQVFNRHLNDIKHKDPIIDGIITDVYNSKDLKIEAKVLKSKYNLSSLDFEKYMLILEFNFACCLSYNNINGFWREVVTPFYEWGEYLKFLFNTNPSSITKADIKKASNSNFCFVEDMATILNMAKKTPLSIRENFLLSDETVKELKGKLKLENPDNEYISILIEKLCMLKFVEIRENKIYVLENSKKWVNLSNENKALKLYQHPLNQLSPTKYRSEIFSEKNIRNAEKSILRVLNSNWIYLNDFIKGITVAISDDQKIKLKQNGKNWRYTVPIYSEEQKNLIKAVVMDWLFEMGIVMKGTLKGRDCFKITAFGKKVFES